MPHDYQRHGTTTLFAALNVLEGTVIDSCHARHRHQEFRTFLNVPHIHTYNQQAGPFIWTAPVERILEKVMKCRAVSESLH